MKLVKVNYCYIIDQQDCFTIIGETIDSGAIIATYKSKERALEVLDEIQKKIIICYKEHNNYKQSLVFGTNVYEMPEE